jgi:hypothetical protein
MPVKDRFDATLNAAVPVAYAIPKVAGLDSALSRLRLHGIVVEEAKGVSLDGAQVFMIDSIVRRGQPFQGHVEVRLEGTWVDETRTRIAGTGDALYVIRTAQPLGVLAMQLLEPQSDDGLVTWNFFDFYLDQLAQSAGQGPFIVVRLTKPIAFPTRIVP